MEKAEALQEASVAAFSSPGPHSPGTASYLVTVPLVALIAASVTGCGDYNSGDNQPARDCISYRNGQSVGTVLCGPSWDSDNDTISTKTETNPANRTDGYPVSGFYTFDTLKWDINQSRAVFGPSDGFLDFGMNLRDAGDGYVHYLGTDQVDTDDWGTGHLLRLIEGSGRSWADSIRIKGYPHMMTGDMSLRTGGYFYPHASHRNGLDVDVRYIRKDRSETDSLNICTQGALYDTLATLSLFNTIVVLNGDGRNNGPWVEYIFVDTACVGIVAPPDDPYIRYEDGHRNHFHVRIRDPDGT